MQTDGDRDTATLLPPPEARPPPAEQGIPLEPVPEPSPVAEPAPAPSSATDPEKPDPNQVTPAAPADAPPRAPGVMDRMPLWVVPVAVVAIPFLIYLIGQAVPSFYDNIVWKHYWGPIQADAENRATLTHNGVVAESGYNVVNTLTWAVLLGLCIAGIAQMLRRYQTPMDARLVVAATSWVVVGSMAHVLEDAGLLRAPLQYLFITPPIYLLFGAFGVGAFLIGQWLKRVEARHDVHAALRLLWIVHVVLVLVYLGLWLKPWDQVAHYVNPLIVAAIAVVSFFFARHFILRKGTIDPSQLCLTLSLGTYILVIAYLVMFLQDPWIEPSDNAIPLSSIMAPLLAGIVTALVAFAPRKAILGALAVGVFLVVTCAAYLVLGRVAGSLPALAAGALSAIVGALVVARAATKLKPRLGEVLRDMHVAYLLPVNLLIVFGQLVDAFATSYGIDLAGYEEKHVLSAAIIDEFRELSASLGFDFGAKYPTFIAFVGVKLLVSLLVIFAIDIYSKDDAKTNPTMIGLVKFAIIMVGLGPGVRDFVRLSLGV